MNQEEIQEKINAWEAVDNKYLVKKYKAMLNDAPKVEEEKEEEEELDLDLNNDGVVDKKDASIAGKVLRKVGKRKKKK